MGKSKANLTGSTGVGYALLNADGTTNQPRSTTGVYQLSSGSGLYAAQITFPDTFHGSVIWDTGEVTSSLGYATEQYNIEENDPKVADTWQMINDTTGSIQSLVDISYGRWKIVSNQMIFYKSDNVTEVVRFNLFDDSNNPTMDAVFDRQKV